ncbi:MAG: MFS transporter [Flavobacteriales bacterium]|nr:MFS transporter [Flavobacteriales bacterium]
MRKHNIIKLHILKGISWFMLSMPIIVIFFQDHGLSLAQIMQLQAAYSLSVAIFEIPSGYIADLFGRKKTIVLSTLFSFFGFLIFSFFSGFNEFIIAEICVGIGGSLMSGSDTALLYDTLIEENEQKTYTRVEGKNYAIGNFSESIAGIVGGLLAVNHLYLPVYLQTIILFFSIPISLSLIEPKANKKLALSFQSIKNVLYFSLIKNLKLKWLIIFSSFMGVATLSIAWLAQPFFQEINIPILYFGLLWALLNLTAGISSFNSHKFSSKSNIFKYSIIMIVSFILLSLYQSLVGLIFIFIIYAIRGLVTPLLKNLININISSEKRATILSIRSFIIRISFATLAPFLGLIADKKSLQYSFFILTVIIIITLCLSCFKLYKLDKKK